MEIRLIQRQVAHNRSVIAMLERFYTQNMSTARHYNLVAKQETEEKDQKINREIASAYYKNAADLRGKIADYAELQKALRRDLFSIVEQERFERAVGALESFD